MNTQQKETLDTYRLILKLIRYIQMGNVTTTTLALICLNDRITNDAMCLQAILDGKAINIMLNILEATASHIRRTQIAIMRCLTKLCENEIIQNDIISSGGLKLLYRLLSSTGYELKIAVAQLISNIASAPEALTESRACGGIDQLIDFLKAPYSKLNQKALCSNGEISQVKVATAKFAAKTLTSLCKDQENRSLVGQSGISAICLCWLRSKHDDVIIPILSLVEQLLVTKSFRKDIIDSGMLQDILRLLGSTHIEQRQAVSQLILTCLQYPEIFKYFQKPSFVTEVFSLLSNSSYHENKNLMYSLSGILWKFSQTSAGLQQIETLNTITVLVQLLINQHVEVKANIVGILGMCLKRPYCKEAIKKNGIEAMVRLLKTTHSSLLINLNKTLCRGSEDREILIQYQDLDAVQHIWSCLKNTDYNVQSSAAAALCIIIQNMKKQNLEVHNVLDGIESVINLLSSTHRLLLTPACTLIYTLAQDKDVLPMLIEFNVAERLASLISTNNKKLLQELCLAVASCCSTPKSCERFASCDIIPRLLNILKTKDHNLRAAAAFALSQISVLPMWCPVAYQIKIKPVLVKMITDVKNKGGNESAAIILRNLHGIEDNDCDLT